MKAKKYKMGGQVDPRKKYSTKPMTPQEQKEFNEMMRKYRNTMTSPVGGEAQRSKYEERFMQMRNRFSKGGKMYMGGGKMSMYMGGGVMEYLKGGQMKLDANKDGMISKADFEMLRKMKK